MKLREDQVDAFGNEGCVACQQAKGAAPGAGGAGAGGSGGAASVRTLDPNKPSWITLELKDTAGTPVPGAAYRVTLADETVVEGQLDKNGKIRLEGIDPGTCKVCFPEWDTREWKPA